MPIRVRTLGLLAVVGVALSASCVRSNAEMCANGLVCPAGSTCDEESGRCLVPEQFAVCAALPERASCQFRGLDGICIRGACLPASCGDGIVSGAEQCDGEELGGSDDCGDLGYYDATPLVCGMDCRYDRSVCTAGLCGDTVRNGPEVCDGDDLAVSDCMQLGFYEPGPLTCNAACAYNTSECRGYCGDAALNGPEVCEEGLPILDTCVNYGYDRGYLACTRCLPDISSCRFIGWRRLAITPSTIIRSMDGTGRRNVFAAGSDGALMHYDGTRWIAQTPAMFDHFRAIAVFATDHAVALGELGTIQRFNGTSWTLVMSDATWRFNGVVRVGAMDAFAVGNRGVLRYNGTTWTTFAAPGTTELTDIWGTSASDLYVIDTAGVLSHYNGSTWQTENLPGNPTAIAVWGTGPGKVYVAASGSTGLYYLVGTQWQSNTIGFGTITAGAGIGGDAFCLVGTQSTVWCNDGVYWSMLAGSGSGFGDLGAVWASAADDVFVAGTAGIQHFEGSSWFALTYPSAPLRFWGDATVLYATTVAGTIVKQTGASQFGPEFTGTNSLYGIWGSGPTDVFAVGASGAIYRYAGTWSKMTNTDSRALFGVWGSGPTSVFAVGTAGAFLRYNGSWSALASGTTADFKAVWGSSATDVFAVGTGGTIVRFNGTSFTTLASGTTRDLRAIFGVSATDIYAVGDVGTIVHFDGTTWTPIPAGTGARLNDVWGTSGSDILVVGDLGVMLHFDGTRWTPVKRPPVSQLAIYGVTNDIYLSVAGTTGAILERLAPW
jgi:hypothetical protein